MNNLDRSRCASCKLWDFEVLWKLSGVTLYNYGGRSGTNVLRYVPSQETRLPTTLLCRFGKKAIVRDDLDVSVISYACQTFAQPRC